MNSATIFSSSPSSILSPPLANASSLLILQFINLLNNNGPSTANENDIDKSNHRLDILNNNHCCTEQCGLLMEQPLSAPFATGSLFPFLLGQSSTGISSYNYDHNPYFQTSHLRIVGGKDTPIQKIPWQVSFQRTKGYLSNYRHFCGGSIISPQWILTAAHCFSWLRNNLISAHELRSIQVKVGISSTRRDYSMLIVAATGASPVISSNSKVQTSKLDLVIKFPLYRKSSSKHDLALVKLSQPLTLYPNTFVNAICLPNKSQTVHGMATVSGFGRTSEAGKPARTLQSVNVTIRSEEECLRIYQSTYVPPNMICAGDQDEDSCQGDSGGPLFKYNHENGRYFLYGIVSYGVGCGRREYPGIYTRVSHYIDWIRRTIGSTYQQSSFSQYHSHTSEDYYFSDYFDQLFLKDMDSVLD